LALTIRILKQLKKAEQNSSSYSGAQSANRGHDQSSQYEAMRKKRKEKRRNKQQRRGYIL
jgi:hypothetical protein